MSKRFVRFLLIFLCFSLVFTSSALAASCSHSQIAHNQTIYTRKEAMHCSITVCKCALCNKTVDCGQHVHPGPTPYEPHRWQYTDSHVSNGVDNHTSTCTAKCVDCGYSYSLGSYVYSHEYRLIDNNHSTGTVHIYTYKCRDCGQKKNIRYTCPGNPCIPMP